MSGARRYAKAAPNRGACPGGWGGSGGPRVAPRVRAGCRERHWIDYILLRSTVHKKIVIGVLVFYPGNSYRRKRFLFV